MNKGGYGDMTHFEEKLRELAKTNIGLAVEMLVDSMGVDKNYFLSKSEDGDIVFASSHDQELPLDEMMEDAISSLHVGIEFYREVEVEENE